MIKLNLILLMNLFFFGCAVLMLSSGISTLITWLCLLTNGASAIITAGKIEELHEQQKNNSAKE
jgi:hypothetical protein